MKKGLFWLGMLSPFLLAGGGVVYAITGEMSTLPLVLFWSGLLLLFLFFYVNFSLITGMLSQRSARYGLNLTVMISVFIFIIWMVAFMSTKYKWRVDLTGTQRYTLSAQTIKVLKGLDREVEAIAFYRSDERTRQAMHDILEEYSYHSSNFNFWFVDPDRKPAQAASYGVTSYRTTLLRSGGNEEILGFESEEKITNALLKVSRDEVKVIYFIKGHGENSIEDEKKSGYKAAMEAIKKENYEVKELLLTGGEGSIPKDASLLVISGPEKDLLPGELESLTGFLDRAGSVLFMLDPGPLPSLIHFLGSYGFEIGDNIIIDKLGRLFGTNYLTPVVSEYNKKHPLTNEFNLSTFFPMARSVEIVDDPKKGTFTLAKTSPGSFGVNELTAEDGDDRVYDPKRDIKGPLGLVAVSPVKATVGVSEKKDESGEVEESIKRWGRILVVGDSNFADNTHLNLAGNKDFFLNIINWLNQETDLISIRRKDPSITPLMLTEMQGNLVFWLTVIVLPSLIATLGIAVVIRRRMAH